MKKLIAVLLTCLLVGAMLPCALAEEVYAEAVDPVTVEQEGAELDQDETAGPGEAYTDFVYEGEADFYVPEEAPMASPASDFVIENGVLKKYVGPGGDVVIPGGVTVIGESSFYGCSAVSSVSMPDSVTIIEGAVALTAVRPTKKTEKFGRTTPFFAV